MDNYLGQSQEQKQRQTLNFRQKQGLEFLALPVQDLEQKINEELASNPVIELAEAPPAEPAAGVKDGRNDFASGKEVDSVDANRDGFQEELENMLSRQSSPDFDREEKLSDPDGLEEYKSYVIESVPGNVSTQELLREQLAVSDCPARLYAVAEEILGSLDENGYLATPDGDIAQSTGASLADVEEALKIIRTFDPPGIGARDLKECLLLQLERLGRGNTLEERIVKDHLDDLAHNRLPAIAKATGVSMDELQDAINAVRKLNPRPCAELSESRNEYVEPEVFITKDGDEYKVTPNRNAEPHLVISKTYMDMLENPSVPADAKKFIKEKLSDGELLKKTISMRSATITRIAELIAANQYEFFEKGQEYLKPMTMGYIAERMDRDESTISRAVSGKYMQTPRGMIPFRKFFSSGFTSSGGEDVSSSSVKEILRGIIDGEDPTKPLSDSKLASMLKEKGLDVARRTVAKYREELGIQPSHIRKVYD